MRDSVSKDMNDFFRMIALPPLLHTHTHTDKNTHTHADKHTNRLTHTVYHREKNGSSTLRSIR